MQKELMITMVLLRILNVNIHEPIFGYLHCIGIVFVARFHPIAGFLMKSSDIKNSFAQ